MRFHCTLLKIKEKQTEFILHCFHIFHHFHPRRITITSFRLFVVNKKKEEQNLISSLFYSSFFAVSLGSPLLFFASFLAIMRMSPILAVA